MIKPENELDELLGEKVHSLATSDQNTVLVEQMTVREFARKCAMEDPEFLRHIVALPKDGTHGIAFTKTYCVEMSAENAYEMVKDIELSEQRDAGTSVH